MPYTVAKEGSKYLVKKKDGGKVIGTHDTKEEATAQIVAININEHKKQKQH